MKRVVTMVVSGLALLVGSATLYIAMHCKWEWSDIRFEKVSPESISQVELLQPIRGSKSNLSSENLSITSRDAIHRILGLMHQNKDGFLNHPETIWETWLDFKFVNRNPLRLKVINTRNQGCMIEFCADCFGIKSVVQNDSLCAFLTTIVAPLTKVAPGKGIP